MWTPNLREAGFCFKLALNWLSVNERGSSILSVYVISADRVVRRVRVKRILQILSNITINQTLVDR